METNVNYTVVGSFVIILLACLILAIIWLSSGFSFEKSSMYLIYMRESVSGLGIDSEVEFNGVDVGSVKSVELNDQNPQLVEVLISIKSNTPITQGTVATLSSRGLTGVVYVALKDDSSDLRPLKVEPGQIYPVIPTAPSIFVRLDTALEQASQNFKKITNSMEALLDAENLAAFKQTLRNLQVVTNTLALNNQRLTTILQNTQAASLKLSPLLETSTQAIRTLQTQTLPVAYTMLESLNTTAINLKEVSNQLKQNPAVLIRGAAPAPLGPGE